MVLPASPIGSNELMVAMQTPTEAGLIGLPTILWSRPGAGKTSFVESLQRPDFPVVTLIGSIHEPMDFNGIPLYESGHLRFAPPEWTGIFDEAQQGILFLDELTTAPGAVQAALLRLTLARCCGLKRLPAGVRIIAAANPPDETAGTWDLSEPLANRFVHIRWELSAGILAHALEHGFACPSLPEIDLIQHTKALQYWKSIVACLLIKDPSLAYTKPADGEWASASPRTWDYAARLMASCQLLNQAPVAGKPANELFCNLLVGAVGSGAAMAVVQYIKQCELPDTIRVLTGQEQVNVEKLADDELHVFFGSMANELLLWRDSPRYSKTAREGGGKQAMLDAILIVLNLADQTQQHGRSDVIYVPLRNLARGQILQEALVIAEETGRLDETEAMIRRVFEGTSLDDFIEFLEHVA